MNPLKRKMNTLKQKKKDLQQPDKRPRARSTAKSTGGGPNHLQAKAKAIRKAKKDKHVRPSAQLKTDGNAQLRKPRVMKRRRLTKNAPDSLRRSASPDELRINPERLQRHDAGASALKPENAVTRVAEDRMKSRKRRFVDRAEQTARAEILNEHQQGGITAEEGAARSSRFLQQIEIADSVDVTNATKRFDLTLDQFGPYRFRYTPNGRHLLLGGRRGHVATLDWMTKALHLEINVMETVRDVQWLHIETMFAVAQKRYLRIYDNQGTELHCIKSMFDIQRLEFLPRHMLLVAGAQDSFIHYLDVCIGKMVRSFRTRRGPLNVMTHNPANGIVLTGSERGVVAMWSPNATEPLVEMFTHAGGVRAISADESGRYLATAGVDNRLKIFDIRTYKELHCGFSPMPIQQVAFSQTCQLAVASGGIVKVFNDAHHGHLRRPYLQHMCDSIVTNLHFCPYEDVLGVGHETGFSSLLIPGSGNPDFDALRANPFESKTQRKEREVHMLLNKLQSEMITLNPADINRINRRNLKVAQDYRREVLRVKEYKVQQEPEGNVELPTPFSSDD